MKLKGKKGNVVVGILGIIFLVFALSISTAYLIDPLSEMSDEITSDPLMSNESKEIIQSVETHYVGLWDGVIVFALVMLWIFSVISAFFIDSHPIFFIITILLLIAVFYVAALISNEYSDLTSSGVLDDTAQYYENTRWIMSHLLEIAIFIAISYTLAIYTKLKI